MARPKFVAIVFPSHPGHPPPCPALPLRRMTARGAAACLALLVALAGTPVIAARVADRRPQGPAAVAARIRRVETGLLPTNVVKGEPAPRIDLAAQMKGRGVPGVSIAVLDDFRVAWARGYGSRAANAQDPVTADTLFQAASVSKVVTTVAALRLVERGKLDLDEDVNRRLVSWKVPESELTRTRKVTLRGILTHTAGFGPQSGGEYRPGGPVPTLRQILRGESPATTPPVRVQYEPGTREVYSGAGFMVLQQLLVDVTGKPFPRLVEELVFRPLGMNSSTFEQDLPPALRARAASGFEEGRPVPGGWDVKPGMASGGLWSTPSDLARLAAEIQLSALGRSDRVLSRATTTLMLSPQQTPAAPGAGASAKRRGLGVELETDGASPRFVHGGNNNGFRSLLIGTADGKGVVVMTNGSSSVLLSEIARAVAAEYGWAGTAYAPRERSLVTLAPGALAAYAGRYENEVGQSKTVTLADGRLTLDGAVPLRAESDSASETRFFGINEATYVFLKDTAGKVTELVIEIGALKMRGVKVE